MNAQGVGKEVRFAFDNDGGFDFGDAWKDGPEMLRGMVSRTGNRSSCDHDRIGEKKGKRLSLAISFFTPANGRATRPSPTTDPLATGLDIVTSVRERWVDVLLPAIWSA